MFHFEKIARFSPWKTANYTRHGVGIKIRACHLCTKISSRPTIMHTTVDTFQLVLNLGFFSAFQVLLKTHKCGTDEEKSVKKIEYVTCKLCDQQFRSKTFVMHYRRVHGGYPPGYENRRKYMWSVGLLSFYLGGVKVSLIFWPKLNIVCYMQRP